jgi:hypothetical protein
VDVPAEIEALLRKAGTLSVQTEGAFDFTLGALKDLWGFDSNIPRFRIRPRSTLLAEAGPGRLVLRDGTAFLTNRGAAIDLGGFGAGLLIDRGVLSLRQAGIKAGIVETSGELRAFGRKPGRKPWRIGVRHPRDPNGGLIGVLLLDEAGVSTSGDYERFFMENGKRYCHILDPATGFRQPLRQRHHRGAGRLTPDAFDTRCSSSAEGMALIEGPGIRHHRHRDGRILSSFPAGLNRDINRKIEEDLAENSRHRRRRISGFPSVRAPSREGA